MKVLVAIGAVLVLAGFGASAEVAQASLGETSCTPKFMRGTPCKPFLNPARTARFVRAKLLANDLYNVRVTVAAPIRINYTGTRNGVRMYGSVFKLDRERHVKIPFMSLECCTETGSLVPVGWSRTYRTSFVP